MYPVGFLSLISHESPALMDFKTGILTAFTPETTFTF